MNRGGGFEKHKKKKRESETYKSQVKGFANKLDKLFDIAHVKAFDIVKIEMDKDFLRSPITPGHPGGLLGVVMKLMEKEKTIDEAIKQQK